MPDVVRHVRANLLGSFVLLVYAFMLAPVVIVLVVSVFDDEIVTFPPSGFTLSWYANAWAQRDFSRGMVTSLQVAVAATAIGVPLGTAAAFAIARGATPGAGALTTLLLSPLAVPGIVAGAAVYMFFVRAGDFLDRDVAGTFHGLIAAHVMLTIPWTMRLVLASLQALDRRAEEAAANLGASPWTVFRRVTLPHIRPGLVAGALFSFIQSFENLELTLFLVGRGSTTLPVAMLGYLEFRMDPTLAAVATVQIILVAALMMLADRFVELARVVK